jgi:dynein heavy chain 1, cytosolic
MYLFPSIEEARFQIMQQLFAWQAIVTSQVRLQSSRYQVGLDKPVSQTYRNLLTKLPSGSETLESSYAAIDSKMTEVRAYVDEWLRYGIFSQTCSMDDWVRKSICGSSA